MNNRRGQRGGYLPGNRQVYSLWNNDRGGRRGSSRRPWRSGGRRGGIEVRFHRDGHQEDANSNILPLLDDDDNMGNEPQYQRSRYTPYDPIVARRRGGRSGRPYMDRRDEHDHRDVQGRLGGSGSGSGPSRTDRGNCYKIIIPHGKKYEKAELLRTLTNNATIPFVPLHFSYKEQTAIFFVNDSAAGLALRALNGKITGPSGHKIIVIATPSSIPFPTLNAEVIDKLKNCMSKRYNVALKSLNLSNLYFDADMTQEGLYLSIGRLEVAENVLKLIKENIPELVSLDLSSNKLYGLDALSTLADVAPNITSLDLANNKIRVEELMNLRSAKQLEQLNLSGNPLCDKFPDRAAYVSAIRKIFPKVIKLDGLDLPPSISFATDTDVTLPSIKGNFFVNSTVQNLICRFLEQYFTIYDSGNRQPLLDAYHDNVNFSISIKLNNFNRDASVMGSMLQESRNLLKVTDSARRFRALKIGRLTVVAFLEKLPQVEHDPNAFIVDVNHAAASFVSFTVHGIYKELTTSNHGSESSLRSFCRTFVTMPQGSGIVIVNEMLQITSASPEQQQTAFKAVTPTPSSSPAPSSSLGGIAGAVASPSGIPVAPSLDLQQQMMAELGRVTNMNVDWSRKCLEQNSWNYDLSRANFIDLQIKGSIPAEAFERK